MKKAPGGEGFCSRDDWTRTSDLVVPNDARYQLRHIPKVFMKKGGKDNAFRSSMQQ